MTTAAPELRLITPPGDPTAPADLDPRGIRHAPAVRELAFACWVEANGNADRARRLLLAYCDKDTTGTLPQTEDACPSATTIRRWARHEGWQFQFIDSVGAGYRQLLKLAAARLVVLHDQAIDVLDEVTSPGYVPTQHDKVRVDAAKHVTAMMATAMAQLQTDGHAALAQHAAQQEAPEEFADAAEANKHWIRGGKRDA
jgi:hypothetical protein